MSATVINFINADKIFCSRIKKILSKRKTVKDENYLIHTGHCKSELSLVTANKTTKRTKECLIAKKPTNVRKINGMKQQKGSQDRRSQLALKKQSNLHQKMYWKNKRPAEQVATMLQKII